MIVLTFSIAGFLVVLLLYTFSPFKRPLPTESDYTYHKTPWWQLYYSSKYLCPVKKPASGSGLERVFARDMGPDPSSSVMLNPQPVIINAVGDLMCRRDLSTAEGENLWDHIGEQVFSGDLHIANMEFAVNPDWIIQKLLRFSIPESCAEPLLGNQRYGNFDLVSLANNHINDSLSGGIKSTCDFLDRRGIKFVGGNRTLQEQDQFPIIDCKGIKIAVLSYTFSTNGIQLESNFRFGTNLVRFNALSDSDYDPSLILHHIELARSRGADFIIACNHWGVEFEYFPPERIVRRAHGLLDAGVDLIIGHHPHIINPVERYKTIDGREGVVFYSLGNLTSWGLKFPVQKMSEMASIILETGFDSSGKKMVRIGDLKLMPVLHTMNKAGKKTVHKLLPVLRCVEDVKAGKNIKGLSRKDIRMLLKGRKGA